ncbi:MAG: NAD(P)/FAD-dependent oxidoreductase [Candidatus Omnitrophica bacterium]|nr:NAD(P)/FAD-dependent oxidoreductase [Candidatus Omnitrophota bacterium]
MIAAGRAAELGRSVLLLERNNVLGVKLRITGNGRCNVTNAVGLEGFAQYYVDNPKFLYNVFNNFFNVDLRHLLRKYGVKTKIEENSRVFPATDKSGDIIKALQLYLERPQVDIKCRTLVTELVVSEGQVKGVKTLQRDFFEAGKIIIATGGKSYPQLGSNGSGYQWAKKAGHDLIKCRPGLAGIEIKEGWIKKLQGVSINADISLYCAGKKKKQIRGDIVFSHYGISGPAAFDMSMYIDLQEATLRMDIIGCYTYEQAIEELNALIRMSPRAKCKNVLLFNIPRKLLSVCLDIAGINEEKALNQLNKKEKRTLLNILKSVQLTVQRLCPLEEAMVTRGGVDTCRINPKTMESKIIKGLYFCGEVIDIAGLTGGFNLQAAFSTGYVAGESSASGTRYY